MIEKMKDLIIGGASGYDWEKVKYWVNSIKTSGFSGDIVLVATNITKNTIDKLLSKGVSLALYGEHQPDGSFVVNRPANRAPHVERFFYMWNHLMTTKENYRYVIATDTRDVIFQTNPSEWLVNNIDDSIDDFVCASEGMIYADEPWGRQNYQQCFGPFFFEFIKDELIYNVGTFGGRFHHVRDLMLNLFQMSLNRPIPIVDQAVFNFLINQFPYKNGTYKAKNIDAWAAQMGTTAAAVAAGAGDLGQAVGNDPTAKMAHSLAYKDKEPIIEDGWVLNQNRDKFCIVHQWDRIPVLREVMESKYGSS